MDKPLQKNYVKATDKEPGAPRYSQNWAFAKRTFYKVFADRVEVGGWVIPFGEIKDIVLYKTKQMFIPVYVLDIQTEEKNYQIGFSPWADPLKNLPMSVKSERIRLKYSPYSMIIRLALVGILIYWVWLVA